MVAAQVAILALSSNKVDVLQQYLLQVATSSIQMVPAQFVDKAVIFLKVCAFVSTLSAQTSALTPKAVWDATPDTPCSTEHARFLRWIASTRCLTATLMTLLISALNATIVFTSKEMNARQ